MEHTQLLEILQLQAAGKITEEQKTALSEWLDAADEKEIRHLLDAYEAVLPKSGGLRYEETGLSQKIENKLDDADARDFFPGNKIPLFNWKRWAVAASILLIASAILLFTLSKTEKSTVVLTPEKTKVNSEDIAPGSEKAILTIADGSQIILDSAANGTLTTQGKTKVMKLENGQLVYRSEGTSPGETLYNTMRTPRGGQYRLLLPDGSRVWLNAASSIRYPVSFTGNERKVEISGEVYFEVAHESSRPFKILVTTGGEEKANEIEVLGTHFNVNAYDDEPFIKTTLLEGKIKMSGRSSHKILQPGQQLTIDDDKMVLTDNADTEEAVAWKEGRFQFKSADIKSVMRQIARWYDVEVVFKATLSTTISGKIPRTMTASNVFKVLEELTGNKIHFSIEDKKVIVNP